MDFDLYKEEYPTCHALMLNMGNSDPPQPRKGEEGKDDE